MFSRIWFRKFNSCFQLILLFSGCFSYHIAEAQNSSKLYPGNTNPVPANVFSFKDGQRGRLIVVYKNSEFTSMGIIPGTAIDTLQIQVKRKGTVFNQSLPLSVMYSLVTPPATFISGVGASVPAYGSGPWTLYNGTLPSTGASSNTVFDLKIPLIPGSMILPNTTQWLMFEFCYDLSLNNGSGSFELQSAFTPIYNLYMDVYGTNAFPCQYLPSDPGLNTKISSMRPVIQFIY